MTDAAPSHLTTAYEVIADCLREHPLWPSDKSGMSALDAVAAALADLVARCERAETALRDAVDVALWVVAIESWPIEERVEWVAGMRPRVLSVLADRAQALAALAGDAQPAGREGSSDA